MKKYPEYKMKNWPGTAHQYLTECLDAAMKKPEEADPVACEALRRMLVWADWASDLLADAVDEMKLENGCHHCRDELSDEDMWVALWQEEHDDDWESEKRIRDMWHRIMREKPPVYETGIFPDEWKKVKRDGSEEAS